MKELSLEQQQEVNGGILPIVIGIVCFDLGLIATMGIAYTAMGSEE